MFHTLFFQASSLRCSPVDHKVKKSHKGHMKRLRTTVKRNKNPEKLKYKE